MLRHCRLHSSYYCTHLSSWVERSK
jgi:hypothetical protein